MVRVPTNRITTHPGKHGVGRATPRRVAPGGPARRRAQQRGLSERSRHHRLLDVLDGAWNGDVTGSQLLQCQTFGRNWLPLGLSLKARARQT